MSKYILSDSESNDCSAYETNQLTEFLYTKRDFKKSEINPLLLLSENMKSSKICLYDNELLLSQFPEGLVTETFILLPIHKFNSLREDFSSLEPVSAYAGIKGNFYIKNFGSNWAAAFSAPLLQNLELKLQITLSEEEKNNLLNSVLENVKNIYDSNQLNKTTDFSKLPLQLISIKNEDLYELLKNEDLSILSALKNMIAAKNEDTTLFKQWLSQYPEYFDKFPTIVSCMSNISLPLQSFTTDTLQQNVKDSIDFNCSIFKPFIQIVQLIDQFKKDSQDDIFLFIEKSKNNLFPVLFETSSRLFDLSLQYFKQILFPNISEINKQYNRNLILDAFFEACIPFYDDDQREYLIKDITGLNAFSSLHFEGDKELLKKKLAQQNISKPKM